jgi:OFA family oxalate/formate antiporter-like MFS transporter
MDNRLLMLVGHLIMCISILSASYCKKWWTFVLVYSIGFPAGIGIVFWVPVMCGWEWFPNNKGLVSGTVVAGYGFGAFIFGFVSTAIANPDNLKVKSVGPPFNDHLFPIEVGQ